ncbi:MAG: 16S rRNA (guanine(966)-N(2))-methyltransferase RsmD [Deltaproteobacteria bacterium]|nr:16S rRNA (guanine(966)-N(2))-methyltransferase RsmD [Deltaproteobacteria bacterium]
MRIISGKCRGRKLHTFAGKQIRPTTDRMRESIFNILSSRVHDAMVLDLFAGSGALGLEALSRGARAAVFIDNQERSLNLLKKNIEACRMPEATRIIRWDIERSLNCLKVVRAGFDLVFMDPPYNRGLIEPGLRNLHASGAAAPEARIVVEHASEESLPLKTDHFELVDQRTYGKTLVSFIDYVL